jgi:hypothetical protein
MPSRWASSLCVAFAVVAAACAAPAREVALVEMQDAKIDAVPLGLRSIEMRPMWRHGHRETVAVVTLLFREEASNTIRSEILLEGDEIYIAKKQWRVERVEVGTARTRARVVLRSVEP